MAGWLIACGLLLTRMSVAQTNAPDLEKALKAHPLELRSYSADAVANYTWADGKLAVTAPHGQTLGEFSTKSVRFKKGHLIVEGIRNVLVYDKKSSTFTPAAPIEMRLEIELGAADPATVFPALQDALFYPDRAAGLAGLPNWIRGFYGITTPRVETGSQAADSDPVSIDPKTPGVTAPKLSLSVPPESTEAANRENIHGHVGVVFQVSPAGKPDALWLLRPLGYGLDQKALDAVRKYQFKPAEKDGKPVRVTLAIEVTFDAV
ncbi:energy transducer TonB [Granulicella rosea]|nr:energy transducer TonB [Granulicella rosea]